MQTMGAGAFKAKCLQVMDEVQATREPVLITKRGKPVARLVPLDVERSSVFDFMEGQITAVLGEVDVPVIPESDWKRLK